MTTKTLNPQLEEGWKKALAEEFGAEYMKELKKKLMEEIKKARVSQNSPWSIVSMLIVNIKI